jgi:hypothetical protein
MINLELTFDSINTSIQVGDLVFYLPTVDSEGGFDYSSSTPLLFGTVTHVGDTVIHVAYDSVNNPYPAPNISDYIMFAKNKSVNISNLKGYYLEATFINDSNKKIELFSVGSEVSESSK